MAYKRMYYLISIDKRKEFYRCLKGSSFPSCEVFSPTTLLTVSPQHMTL